MIHADSEFSATVFSQEKIMWINWSPDHCLKWFLFFKQCTTVYFSSTEHIHTSVHFSLSAVYCDYYNNGTEDCTWHYSPCHTPCYKTCLNLNGTCSNNSLPNLEGELTSGAC